MSCRPIEVYTTRFTCINDWYFSADIENRCVQCLKLDKKEHCLCTNFGVLQCLSISRSPHKFIKISSWTPLKWYGSNRIQRDECKCQLLDPQRLLSGWPSDVVSQVPVAVLACMLPIYHYNDCIRSYMSWYNWKECVASRFATVVMMHIAGVWLVLTMPNTHCFDRSGFSRWCYNNRQQHQQTWMW